MIKTKKHMIKLKNALNCNFECFLTFKKPSDLDYKSTKNLPLTIVLSLPFNLHSVGTGCTLGGKNTKFNPCPSSLKRLIFTLLAQCRYRLHTFRYRLHKKSVQVAQKVGTGCIQNLLFTLKKNQYFKKNKRYKRYY